MEKLIKEYNSQIELKKAALLREVENFSFDELASKYGEPDMQSQTRHVSAPYRPWLILGGGATLAGLIGNIADGERNWTMPVLLAGVASVGYGLVKFQRLRSYLDKNVAQSIDYYGLKNAISEETKKLADRVIREWDDFIAPINKDIQASLQAMEGCAGLDDALNKTYYVEKIMIDQLDLLLGLNKVKQDGESVSRFKVLTNQFLEKLRVAIEHAVNNQIKRYNEILLALNCK